jgi:hypothetical protein
MFVAAALTLALAGVASALSYRTGTYTAGNPAKGAGVQMKVGHGSFSVQVIRYLETCSYGSRNQVDYFTFRSGTRASLTGRVAKNGDFSGRYSASSGAASVSGHVQGGRATITGSEHGPYNPASTVQPNSCHGSHTFHATLKAG